MPAPETRGGGLLQNDAKREGSAVEAPPRLSALPDRGDSPFSNANEREMRPIERNLKCLLSIRDAVLLLHGNGRAGKRLPVHAH